MKLRKKLLIFTLTLCIMGYGGLMRMIDFEEELKKFHPSLEVEDVEDAIYNQDVTDLADVLVKMVKESKEEQVDQ